MTDIIDIYPSRARQLARARQKRDRLATAEPTAAEALVKNRCKWITRAIRRTILAEGIEIRNVGTVMRQRSASRIPRHLGTQGKLTLEDLVILTDYFPGINVDELLQRSLEAITEDAEPQEEEEEPAPGEDIEPAPEPEPTPTPAPTTGALIDGGATQPPEPEEPEQEEGIDPAKEALEWARRFGFMVG
jgi:hypothetical protein